MKAIIWTAYGPPDVLQLEEVEKPSPKDNEVLIRIFATTVTAGDCEQRGLKLPIWHRLPVQAYAGFKRPTRITILGMELAGEIESAGKDVKLLKKGDQVFAATGFADMGTYAEYICLAEEPEEGALAIKPANMTYGEAASVPVGGLEALHFLRQGNIRSGQKVLINGAGGTIGSFAVQIAKYFGAEVTAVDSAEKLEMLRSIGADYVVDYTQEDFTQSDVTYDFILDVVSKGSFSGCIRSLKRNGRYLIANPGLAQMIRGRWFSLISRLPTRQSGKKVVFGAAYPNTENLVFLKELIEAGKLKSVIDRCYSLEQTAEAHRYVEEGHKKGNVVITVRDSSMT
jgi:NADPH:quinone reductase-like Zn-dependent oxidoreductase